MKIGIVTHWMAVDNYGGMLQSYALQKYFQELGHDAYLIRYHRRARRSLKIQIKDIVLQLLVFFNLYPKAKDIKRSKKATEIWTELRNFSSFRDNNIKLSPRVYLNLKDIQENYPEADIYITGSDQVWAGDLTNLDEGIFYLDFGKQKTKRFSYAASFGHTYFPGKDEERFRNLLSHFDKISVREDNGVEICKKYGFSATRCIDSTMLLSSSHYINLMSPRKYTQPFSFFYTVNASTPGEIYWNEVKQMLDARNIHSVVTTGSGYVKAKEIFEGATYDYASIEDWLSNIFYAECVYTSSFHGVAFALILQKDFVYLPLKGKQSSGNNRITDLLKSVGLLNRIACCFEDVKKITNEYIDYTHLEEDHFISLKKESRNFIDEMLKH